MTGMPDSNQELSDFLELQALFPVPGVPNGGKCLKDSRKPY
jgi:hypothetical protein